MPGAPLGPPLRRRRPPVHFPSSSGREIAVAKLNGKSATGLDRRGLALAERADQLERNLARLESNRRNGKRMGAARRITPRDRHCTRQEPQKNIYFLLHVGGRRFCLLKFDPRFSILDKWDQLIPPSEFPVEAWESKKYGLCVGGLQTIDAHVFEIVGKPMVYGDAVAEWHRLVGPEGQPLEGDFLENSMRAARLYEYLPRVASTKKRASKTGTKKARRLRRKKNAEAVA